MELKLQSWLAMSQPVLQWHKTLQVDKQCDSEKLKGLHATGQNPFNSF